jgi:class 3 adenylate cyclase
MEVYWEQPRFARFMRRLSRNMRVLHFDKRGTGMSDRFARPPDLEVRADDVRAVMDAAGVDRVALLGWGTGGAASALFLAAAHPDRVLAVCTDGWIMERHSATYQWGMDEDEMEAMVAALVDTWGDEDRMDDFIRHGFGDGPGDAPADDPEFRRWCAKFGRFAASPGGYMAFERMWFETDVRDVLSAVQVPALVTYKMDSPRWGDRDQATYLADRIPAAQLVGVPGKALVAWIEEPEPLVNALEGFLAAVQDDEAVLSRVLATVVFTDIVGSTELAARLGDRAWKQLLEQHHATVRALLARYRGHEVDTAGDGFFASFDGPGRAVRCALAISESIQRLGLQARIGVHTGEVETIDGKTGGIAVNIGARIGALAQPSQVLASQTVVDLVAGSGLQFADHGTYDLKGIPGRWRLSTAVQSSSETLAAPVHNLQTTEIPTP